MYIQRFKEKKMSSLFSNIFESVDGIRLILEKSWRDFFFQCRSNETNSFQSDFDYFDYLILFFKIESNKN